MKYLNTNKTSILKINKENVCIVMDFDKTITDIKSQDSWDASSHMLGDNCKKEMKELYEYYAPIELNYNMNFKQKEQSMTEWYTKCMNLYYKYGMTNEKMEKSIESSNLIFRKGAKEFISKANAESIPIIILSAGIGNVIKKFLTDNNCYCNNIFIISNFIRFDEKGKMKPFNNHEIIHSLNKTMEGHLPKEVEEKVQNKKYKILVGDLCEDEKMVARKEWKDTLKIGILNTKIEENLKTYQSRFDIVLTEEDANLFVLNEYIE